MARAEPFAEAIEPVVHVRGQLAQRRQPGGRGDRAAVERAAVADRARPPRVELGHDVRATPERRQRVAAADDLAERRQVGTHPEPALRPARPDPERDDLVEHEQRPDPLGVGAQEGEERRVRRADAAGALHRLDEDRRELRFPAAQRGFDAVRVAPRQLDPSAGHRRRHARRPGHDHVVGAVVGALERGDQRPAGERPRAADGEHRRLGPGAREAELLDRRQPSADLLGQLDLEPGRGGEGRAAADLRLDRGGDGRMGVAQDERRVVAQEVAILVAIHVADPEAGPGLDVRRIRRAVDGRSRRAAGERAGRPFEERAGPRRPGEVVVDEGHDQTSSVSSRQSTDRSTRPGLCRSCLLVYHDWVRAMGGPWLGT